MAVYDLLSKSAPEILDDELTYKIEDEMEKIRDGENEKKAIDDGKRVLTQILNKFEGHEREIGLGLLSGLRRKDADDSSIGTCMKCGDGMMRIIKMKTGRQFIGCSNYPNCTNTYSLPTGVKITGAGVACLNCGAPMIRGFSGGRKIFEICPNPADKQENLAERREAGVSGRSTLEKKEALAPPSAQNQPSAPSAQATPSSPAPSIPAAVAPEKKPAAKKKQAVKKPSKKKGEAK